MATVVERFAPSPTGAAHLGNAFSALVAYDAATAAGGRFLLRVEDIDQTRCRPEHEAALLDDLSWLGLVWETPTLRQSERLGAYAEALDALAARALTYPCFCSRKDIAAAASAPQEGAAKDGSAREGATFGPDGPAYPGTCRNLSAAERERRIAAGASFALRLDMRRAVAALGGAGVVRKLSFKELDEGPLGEKGRVNLDPDYLIEACGDVLVSGKDRAASYHLAVVLDDAYQGVTHVTRGRDLFSATMIHRVLQALFGRPTPLYRHHRLIRNAEGRRLSKRDRDLSLAALRAVGATPADIRAMLDLPPAR